MPRSKQSRVFMICAVMTSSNGKISCNCPFVRRVHWSPADSLHKGQWRKALMLSFICAWTNGWANNQETGDLRRHSAHYDVTVMTVWFFFHIWVLLYCYFTALSKITNNMDALLWLVCFNTSRSTIYPYRPPHELTKPKIVSILSVICYTFPADLSYLPRSLNTPYPIV